ncbi:MAG: DUF3368 domain-containing protein, partial [Lachnospiraceae bacterium]|nr:DUF3368 domain-containing protein [Lachnospiraceae bacterium]
MIVIADTTPLISLMKIEKLELLNKIFGRVYIPEAVYQELTTNSSFESEARQIKKCGYIQVVSVSNRKAVKILRRATGLDLGESEAIVLTDEQQGNLLLMDEVKGRSVAKQMGIRIMGTIGILMIALEKQEIDYAEIVRSIEILRKSGRHIKNELYEE